MSSFTNNTSAAASSTAANERVQEYLTGFLGVEAPTPVAAINYPITMHLDTPASSRVPSPTLVYPDDSVSNIGDNISAASTAHSTGSLGPVVYPHIAAYSQCPWTSLTTQEQATLLDSLTP